MVPDAVPVPEAMEKAGVVAPAAGAVNLTVVAAVVPKAGTPVAKLKPDDAAVNEAVAAVAVAGAMLRAGTAANAMVAGTGSSLPPPQAASAASAAKVNTSLADVEPLIEN